jgi:hypothetical protein
MRKIEKLWIKIREAESLLIYASPSKACKLTKKIIKWKGQVFDEI